VEGRLAQRWEVVGEDRRRKTRGGGKGLEWSPTGSASQGGWMCEKHVLGRKPWASSLFDNLWCIVKEEVGSGTGGTKQGGTYRLSPRLRHQTRQIPPLAAAWILLGIGTD